jgi:hypothetical protein
MGELAGIDREKPVGIRDTQIIQRISPETFSQCRRFSHKEVKKEYRPGSGIVQNIVETVVYFDCLHPATAETYGGACWLGTEVCKDCLVRCSEPDCSRWVCRAANCTCGGERDGQIYCRKHLATGIMGFLCNLFVQRGVKRGRDVKFQGL